MLSNLVSMIKKYVCQIVILDLNTSFKVKKWQDKLQQIMIMMGQSYNFKKSNKNAFNYHCRYCYWICL